MDTLRAGAEAARREGPGEGSTEEQAAQTLVRAQPDLDGEPSGPRSSYCVASGRNGLRLPHAQAHARHGGGAEHGQLRAQQTQR